MSEWVFEEKKACSLTNIYIWIVLKREKGKLGKLTVPISQTNFSPNVAVYDDNAAKN